MPTPTVQDAIRDPQGFDTQLKSRGYPGMSHVLVPLNEDRRKAITDKEAIQAEINQKSKAIGQKIKAGEDVEPLKLEVKNLKTKLEVKTEKVEELDELFKFHMLRLPNFAEDDVPDGTDETYNVEVNHWGQPKPQGMPHWDIPSVDLALTSGAAISGARFSTLRGGLAKLHRALGQFMLDQHSDRGYEEVVPPTIVNAPALVGTGQLPKFADDLFKIEGQDRYLIPTAEVSLTNLYAGHTLTTDLTHRVTALTECYRAEAGSAGRDTRGLIRQHQFQKVELVTICHPTKSAFEHDFMLNAAQQILARLDIPYRTMLLCKGDMGFGAQKTYDLEAWLPGQQAYREISSVSNCGDFQARRMNIKYKVDGRTEFAHTLNGSGLAVGRTLVAVLENFYEDGKVWIPTNLKPYIGCDYIEV